MRNKTNTSLLNQITVDSLAVTVDTQSIYEL